MDQWIRTGKQVVDGVAGNRPGQRRSVWQDKTNGPNFEKVGRWMEDKIDWFFEDDEEWLENQDSDDDPLLEESIINEKKPLGAISLRAPKALPARIEEKRNNLNEIDEWPDDQSFKLNRWERKNNLIKQNEHNVNEPLQDERSTRKRNIPRSSRRKYS
jgi:hypothetical protein